MLERAGALPTDRRRVRRRRVERDGRVPRVRCRRRGGAGRRRGGGRRARHRASLRVAHARDARRAARSAQLPAAGRRRARCTRRTPSRRGSTIRASGPSTRSSRTAAARVRRGDATTRRSRASRLLSRLEGIIPALETAHAVAWVDARARPVDRRRRRAALRQRSRRQGCGAGEGNGYPGRVTTPSRPAPRGELERAHAAVRRHAGRGAAPALRQGGAGAPALPPQQPDLPGRARRTARRLSPRLGSRPTSSCSASPRAR